MGVQDLVQQDLKPVSFGNAFTKQGSNEVAPQAGRSHPRTPIDFITSVNSVTVKPKPRPRPVKGKVSTELGIVTSTCDLTPTTLSPRPYKQAMVDGAS